MYGKYQCKSCGCTMDPGEGQNGMCEDCVSGETEQRRRREMLDRMIRSTDYKQMEMEEFLK